jgi:hypothetical protein
MQKFYVPFIYRKCNVDLGCVRVHINGYVRCGNLYTAVLELEMYNKVTST